MANGVAEISGEKNFFVFLSNFGAIECRLLKFMGVAYALKSPLVLSKVGVDLERKLATFLNTRPEKPSLEKT